MVVEVPEVGGGSAVGATAEKLVVLGGSAEEADVALPAAAGLEARHATLACRAGKFFLTDASSATGTTMQGAKLMPGVSYLLGDGNVISFGEAEYEVKIEGKGLDKPPSMEETLMRQMVEQKLKARARARASVRASARARRGDRLCWSRRFSSAWCSLGALTPCGPMHSHAKGPALGRLQHHRPGAHGPEICVRLHDPEICVRLPRRRIPGHRSVRG